MTSAKKRILVVLDPAVGEAAAVRALLERDAEEIYIVAPVADASGVAGKRRRRRRDGGERQLDDAMHAAGAAGLAAADSVGSDDDLLTVIGDALAQFPADEIVLVTRPDEKSHWRVEDLAEKVHGRHGKPLRELVLTAREAGASDGT